MVDWLQAEFPGHITIEVCMDSYMTGGVGILILILSFYFLGLMSEKRKSARLLIFMAFIFILFASVTLITDLGKGRPLDEDDLTAGQEYHVFAVNCHSSFHVELLMAEVKEHGVMTNKYYLLHKEEPETFARGHYRCVLENGKKKLVLIKASADSP